MEMVLRPIPRHAVSHIHLECGWREMDRFIQRFFGFSFSPKLAESGGRPAVNHWEVRIRPTQAFRCFDSGFVFARKIQPACNVKQSYRRERIARVKPDAGLDSSETFFRTTNKNQGCAVLGMRDGQVRADCQSMVYLHHRTLTLTASL